MNPKTGQEVTQMKHEALKGQQKSLKAHKGTLLRIFKFITKYYKTYLIIVFICLAVSAVVQLRQLHFYEPFHYLY